MPATLHTRRAFSGVFARIWLPATTVIAASSMSGQPAASRIATASSCPGSQSRRIRRAMALVVDGDEGADRRVRPDAAGVGVGQLDAADALRRAVAPAREAVDRVAAVEVADPVDARVDVVR